MIASSPVDNSVYRSLSTLSTFLPNLNRDDTPGMLDFQTFQNIYTGSSIDIVFFPSNFVIFLNYALLVTDLPSSGLAYKHWYEKKCHVQESTLAG